MVNVLVWQIFSWEEGYYLSAEHFIILKAKYSRGLLDPGYGIVFNSVYSTVGKGHGAFWVAKGVGAGGHIWGFSQISFEFITVCPNEGTHPLRLI